MVESDDRATARVTRRQSPALDDLIRRNDDAAVAYINGEVDRYLELVRHTDDFTLLGPFGGEPGPDSDHSDEAKRATAEFFQGGDATLEVFATYACEDLAVLVGIERQHGTVGGREQDWSLRITLVYRHDGTDWRLVHRHADPLVHPIDFDGLARLARGAGPPAG